VVTVMEFLEGFDDPAAGERLLRPFPWLEVTAEVVRQAARIRRDLRLRGERTGDFDILIAATAQAAGCPLVTDNTTHFTRIEALTVKGYR
jgi:predicted nucleic acid-binding protein